VARTTPDAVEAILLSQYGSFGSDTETLTPFIETATVIVDRVVTCAATKSYSHSTAELERIEAWLAAHFYGHADQFYTSRSTSGASGSFGGQTGMRLEYTQYGQAAMTLDGSGCLEAINAKNYSTRAAWLGKPPSDQIDYNQRD